MKIAKITTQQLFDQFQQLNDKLDGIIDGTTPANAQVTGSNVAEEIHERRIRQSLDVKTIDVQAFAKGFILMAIIHSSTGDFSNGQGLLLRVYSRYLNQSFLHYENNRNLQERHMLVVYPGISEDLPIYGNTSSKGYNTVVSGSLRIDIAVNGTFEDGEGIDCQSQIIWLG